MIHVLAIITAKPGKRDEILGHFRANVPAVKAEKGCIEYGATVDADGMGSFQTKFGPDTFVVVEKWESTDALKAHSARTAHGGLCRQDPRAHRQPRHPRPLADLIALRSRDDERRRLRPSTASSACAAQFDARGSSACARRSSATSPRPAPTRPTSPRAAAPGNSSATCSCGSPIRTSAPPRSTSPAPGDRRRADGLGACRLLLRPAVREGARHGASHAVASGPALLAGEGLADRLGVDRARPRSTAATARSSSSPARTAGA